MRVLLVTNDFPPRVGGIQSYLWNIYAGLARAGIDVRVFAPAWPGDSAFDASCGLEVVRFPGRVWWQTPAIARAVAQHARDADVVAFGAVLPMNLVGTKLDRPVVVHTHGFEVAWTRTPVLRRWLRTIGRNAALVTVVSDYTRRHIERALDPGTRIEMLRTGVDLARFDPSADGSVVRKRHHLGGRPVIACVSRLVPRKGQDTLIRALPLIRREVPDAALLIAGGGPHRDRLERLARERDVADAVVFTGEVPEPELPAHHAAGDVFAMPCRNRYGGLEVEGLGLVYLEAQACARPAIAGDSGGAPEAVVHGETGFVVGGRDVHALADAAIRLLSEPDRARAMGAAGRRFVESAHDWSGVVDRTRAMLGSL